MPTDSSRETRLLLRLAVGCAVLMTGAAGARLLGIGLPSRPTAPAPATTVPVDNWGELVAAGHRLGPPDAEVVIVEFADFECPFCKGYALETLPAIRAAFPDDVAVVYRHLPLAYHRFAVLSAVAVECAGRQGRFEAMHDLLYATQDSIGLLPWEEVARRSGVADAAAWEACRAEPAVRTAVEADGALADRIGATGTPTIVINGLRYSQPLPTEELKKVVSGLLGR